MTTPENNFTIKSHAITDRGLNERRPLNEDSFLADSERLIFAVADGVGGAEAGEVASQTAIEVLDEAFRHQVDGADIEDLMELAIQRANASIHRMAQEHAKFSMMATTMVALHLKGNIATIGHVGDSRLYRLTAEGELVRETVDHSVVEEEVRAGRMTAAQAANHPSKNVISRALGAEDTVEVDLKTIEVEDGTEFLLCSDGITRHISDGEIRQLLVTEEDLAAVCADLKRRCYERGAEDNLTAIVVRLGNFISPDHRHEDLQPTISPETEKVAAIASDVQTNAAPSLDDRQEDFVPASRRVFPLPPETRLETRAEPPIVEPLSTPEKKLNIPDSQSKGSFGRTLARLFMFLFIVAIAGGAFYVGRRYKGPVPFLKDDNEDIAEASPSPVVVEDLLLKFERVRREIDREPNEWLNNEMRSALTAQGILNPLESSDPEFLYLYGRASLLTGNIDQAANAFEQAIIKADANPSAANSTVRKEATLGLAAVAIKSEKDRVRALAHFDEMLQRPGAGASPGVSP
jgi:serine/threonine protein phosphatase PrpC